MTDPAPAPCPVHPANYHDRPQVLAKPAARIFRFESIVGLPQRCARLEDELMDADRELELMEKLWILERRGRGSNLATAAVSAGLGLIVGLAVKADALDGDSIRPLVAIVAVAVGVAMLVELARARVAKVRLERIQDWRKRLGF